MVGASDTSTQKGKLSFVALCLTKPTGILHWFPNVVISPLGFLHEYFTM
jgi:hypothetical protein